MILAEDHLAMAARPPRAPKLTLKDSSSSSSVPSIDTSASCQNAPQGPSSCTSTSSSQQQQHFLKGFNVEGCFDVRSIPDPPTPQAPRNRRRLSSPLVNLRSLEDVTNQANAEKNSNSNSNNIKSKGNKRSRKSLCHVPSPLMKEVRDDPPIPRQAQAPAPAPVPPKTLQVNICMDDDDNESEIANSKRRKKRQSMALPKDLVEQHANAFASVSPQNQAAPASPPTKKAFTGDLESMKQLQKLVRGYCALPQHQRDGCHEAKSIESSTGYPLINPTLDKEDNPLSRSNRRIVLSKVAPVIEAMDKRKVIDTRYWEDATRCRVEKSRSGKFRYYSIATNNKVSTKEYMNRYMSTLEAKSGERRQKANDWKAKLAIPQEEKPDEQSDPRKSPSNSSTGIPAQESDLSMTQELDLDINSILAEKQHSQDSVQAPAQPETPEDDTMELCDLSVSLDLGETTSLFLDNDPSDDHEKIETSSEKLSEVLMPTSPEKAVEEAIEKDHPVAATTNREVQESKSPRERFNSRSPFDRALLPIPDRDEVSMDPDIAQAERKLWNRIDAALDDYSQDVMFIWRGRAKKPAATNS